MSANKKRPNRGTILLEALIAISLLGIMTGFLIQSVATLLKASNHIKDSFEASLVMDKILFDIKSDEKGSWKNASAPQKFNVQIFDPEVYQRRIRTRLLAQSENLRKQKVTYQLVTVDIGQKGKAPFTENLILREEPQ